MESPVCITLKRIRMVHVIRCTCTGSAQAKQIGATMVRRQGGGRRVAVVIDLLRVPTDEELLELSERNPGYQFERTADGRLVVSPTGMESGRRSGEVFRQLSMWNHRLRAGVVFDSSTGFRLPDGSLLSPDASWARRERWEAIPREERE